MDKVAQERTFFSKVRDTLNFSGRILEELNIEFATVMQTLRETDADIRENAFDLKQLATNSIKLVRARHYLDTAVNIAAFHERCRVIAAKLERFQKSVDLRHYSYLLEQLPDSEKKKLFDYNPNAEIKLKDAEATDYSDILIKQAGLTDWLFQAENTEPNSQQNTAMKALENRFKVSFIKKLKTQSLDMTEKTYQFYKYLISTFKKLGWAVATRKIDKYIEISNELISKFAEYHKSFTRYYEANIVPLKNEQERVQKVKDDARKAKEDAILAAEQDAKQKEHQAVEDQKARVQRDLDIYNERQKAEQAKSEPPQTSPFAQTVMAPTAHPAPAAEEQMNYKQAPDEIVQSEENMPIDLKSKTKKAKNLRDRAANDLFINTIEKLAFENKVSELVAAILDHSQSLEEVDADKSLQLLSVAEGLVAEQFSK